MIAVHAAPCAAYAANAGTWPAASIIIVNYNGGDGLTRCLDSLNRDPASRRYEIIVVDNASSDGSVDTLDVAYPGAKLLRNRENVGFGGANNLGAEQARGPILAFLNPDTVVRPGWLQALTAALQEVPGAGLVTAKILLLDDQQRINAAGNDVHLTGLTLCRGLSQPFEAYSQPAEVGAVSGAAFAIRRELFLELGGFDETFFTYFEDTDLSLRARLAGYRCLYVPDSVVCHEYRLRFGPHKIYYEERNRYVTLLKLYRWRTLLLLAPLLVLGEAVTWGFTLLYDRARWANKLRAYADVFRNRRRIMAGRRRTQAARRIADRTLLQTSATRLAYEQVGDGFPSRAAHLLLDPHFYLYRALLGALIRW